MNNSEKMTEIIEKKKELSNEKNLNMVQENYL